jgi:hypothetical protein
LFVHVNRRVVDHERIVHSLQAHVHDAKAKTNLRRQGRTSSSGRGDALSSGVTSVVVIIGGSFSSRHDMSTPRTYRAGESLEDFCRACKTDRLHTIVVVDGDGQPLRVVCGYCHSEHNYRGGGRVGQPGSSTPAPSEHATPATVGTLGTISSSARARSSGAPFPIVSDHERVAAPMTSSHDTDLELLLRRVIREETGITPVVPAEKWRGGTLVLRPGTAGLQEKSWPIETFFHKVVMLRNRLRTLEQQVNASNLPDDVKVKLQTYISGCYGSLTSFNVLFADEDDQFKGSGGD